MSVEFDEEEFIEEAKSRVMEQLRKRRAAGKHDTIVAVVQSPTGDLYKGTTFRTTQPQFDFCAERHALHNMFHEHPEVDSFERLFVAGAVPEVDGNVTTPCGACRHVMNEANPDATVICSNFVRESEGWIQFPTLKRFTVEDLYPHHQPLPTWE